MIKQYDIEKKNITLAKYEWHWKLIGLRQFFKKKN